MTDLVTCLNDDGLQIVREVYKAMQFLGADPGLLGCIGSWGDTMDDKDVLDCIRSWNEMGEPFMPDVVAKQGRKT